MTEELRPETVDFIYEHTKGATRFQLQEVDGRDGRSLQLVGIGGVVLAAGSIASGGDNIIAALALLVATGFFLGVVAAALAVLRPREYRLTDHPERLWKDYWHRSPNDIKHSLVEELPTAWAHNATQLSDKLGSLRWQMRFLQLEAVSVGLSVLFASIPSLLP